MKTVIKVVPVGRKSNRDAASLFAVADIHPGDPSKALPPMLDVVLPMNGRVRTGEVELAPGNYRVRVRLPSGETLVEEVVIPDSRPTSTLVLESDELPAVSSRRRQVREESLAPSTGFYDGRARKTSNSDIEATVWPWSRVVLSSPIVSWLRDSQGMAEILRSQGVGDLRDRHVLNRVRVRASETNLKLPQNSSTAIDEAARSMFGTAVAIQPTKVRESKSSNATSQWKVAERGPRSVGGDTARRFYGVLMSNRDGDSTVEKVASIPDRWIGIDGSLDDVFRAEIVPHPDFPDSERIELSVSDPQAMSLMSFLQSGDLDAALAVAKPAMGFVKQGVENAHAAIAAAYALVYAPAGSGPEGWEKWVLELSSKRQDIPDGKILEATLLLQRNVETIAFEGRRFPPPTPERQLAEAWACVQEAIRRGPPVFRLGLQLLESNLRILRDSDSPAIDGPTAAGAAGVTSWLSARVDPYQPLCVFDVQ